MRTLWEITRKDLLQIVHDRTAFIFMLLMPFILVAVIGFALQGFYNDGSQAITIQVAISDQDHAVVGQAIDQALNLHTSQLTITLNHYATTAQVENAVASAQGSVTGVVIPAGTSARLRSAALSQQPTSNLVQLYTVPTRNDPGSAIIQNIVSTVIGQLATSYFAGDAAVQQVERVCQQPGNHCAPGSIDAAAIASSVGAASQRESPAAQVAALHAGNVPPQINSFDITLPGYALLFALFGLQSVAGTILDERENGTLRRLLIAPVQRYALLGGKVLTQFLVTLVQMLILFAVGSLVFHLHIGNWPAILLMVVVISFAVTGLGTLLIALVRSRRQLSPVVTLVTLISTAIGGAWWPLWLEPQWMQNVARIGLVAWAMEGLNGLMVSGRSLGEILPDVLVLLLYGAVCFLIGIRLFRFQPATASA